MSVTMAESTAVCPSSPDADKYACIAKKMIYTMRASEVFRYDSNNFSVTSSGFTAAEYVGINIKIDLVLLTEHGVIESGRDFNTMVNY